MKTNEGAMALFRFIKKNCALWQVICIFFTCTESNSHFNKEKFASTTHKFILENETHSLNEWNYLIFLLMTKLYSRSHNAMNAFFTLLSIDHSHFVCREIMENGTIFMQSPNAMHSKHLERI